MEMKKLLLIPALALLTGCAQYCGVEQPLSPTPIYPPMYDVRPLRNNLRAGIGQAQKLKAFSAHDNNLMRLNWALDAYNIACVNLLEALDTSNTATISYKPWQTEYNQWRY